MKYAVVPKAGALLAAALVLASCATGAPVSSVPLATATPGPASTLISRESGEIGATSPPAGGVVSYARSSTVEASGAILPGGDVTLDFADADLRDTAARVLGDILHVNYTIDPNVMGTASLRTVQPVTPDQALAALKEVLAQNGATLVVEGNLYHVENAAGAGTAPGGEVIPLRYASADDLAKALTPFAGDNVKIGTAEGMNALVISGDSASREALRQTIDAFDVDTLAGQSYALLPIPGGGAKEYATALQDALQADSNGALASEVRVAPLSRLNAVLVIARSRSEIAAAERVQSLLDAENADTVRTWHVYYLQNSRSDDVANLLQQAFTPNHITVQPAATTTSAPSQSAIPTMSADNTGSSGSQSTTGTSPTTPSTTLASSAGSTGSANPIQGGTDTSSDSGESDQSQDVTQEMRIISNPQNNAVLIYSTATEEDTVEAMLRKIDIVPLQVRIDATIAEVTLNDTLQYGTQFFFKSAGPLTSTSGGINSFLSSVFSGSGSVTGFVFAGSSSAQAALEALQQVTTVRVLSSPEVMAVDNQQATLLVGDLVPILSSSSQSTIANSDVINSIEYHQTGVTLQVTPRVNSGGQVTMDLAQDVSDVDSSLTTAGIDSPSFDQRSVRTRVVVQDGQTVGVAGLIRDNVSLSNQGVPWLKDVPVLGSLFGQQNNTRTRTELLVLITPHVVADQRSIEALTEDLRDTLSSAAEVPGQLAHLPASGSADPNHTVPTLDTAP